MKKKFTFVIDIPDWLYRFRWDNIKSYVNYHINKPTCLTCNTKVTFRHFNIWVNTPHYPLKTRVGISSNEECPSCLSKKIKNATTDAWIEEQVKENYVVANRCDVCHEEKTAFKHLKLTADWKDTVRFCANGSWNGSYVCLDCVDTVLQFGEMIPDTGMFYNGEHVYSVDGLPVVDGKVRFPLI